MKPLLETLPPETIETLIAWCETESAYAAVSQRAAKPVAEGGLNLRISPSSLNRLYTTHNIADSKEARAQYAASLGAECKKLRLLHATRENLEQRLFEITTRPNATVAELRLAAQFIQRADSLSLAQRRVRVAEKREARIAEQDAPEPPITVEEADRRINVLLGKDFAKEPVAPTSPLSRSQRFASQAPENITPSGTAPNQHVVPPLGGSPEPTTPGHRLGATNTSPTNSPTIPIPSASMPSMVNQSAPPIPQSAIGIPQSAIDLAQTHANRSYPDHLRPACPVYRKIFDEGKKHCLHQRILAETENWLKSQTSNLTQ